MESRNIESQAIVIVSVYNNKESNERRCGQSGSDLAPYYVHPKIKMVRENGETNHTSDHRDEKYISEVSLKSTSTIIVYDRAPVPMFVGRRPYCHRWLR